MTTISQMIRMTQKRAFNHGYALAMRKTPETLADMRKVNASLDSIISDV